MTGKSIGLGAGVTAILAAIIEFGPSWKPLVDGVVTIPSSTDKKLSFYVANVTLEEIETTKIGGANIRAYFNVTTEVSSDDKKELFYQDRIKTDGGIDYLKTIPDHQVLNKTQYPDDPTLLEYRIDPITNGDNKFDINGISRLNIHMNQDKGKFGPHMPYDADLAIMTVDFSRLKTFSFPQDMSAQIEVRDQKGALQYGNNSAVVRNWYKINKTVTIIGRSLPKDSSLVLIWGASL